MGCSVLFVEESHIQTIVSQGDVMSFLEIFKVVYVLSLTSWSEQMYLAISVKTITSLWSLKAIFANKRYFDHTTLRCRRIPNYQIMYFSFLDVFFMKQLMMTPRTFKSISWTEYPQLTIYSQFSLFTLLMWKHCIGSWCSLLYFDLGL